MNELKFESSFGRFDGVDDHIDQPLPDGTTARATLVFDEDSGPSWENGDGYGIVSEWRDKDSKTPGERVLCGESGGKVRFYDMEATTKKAKDESWGCGIDAHDHKTKGERTACAVEQDFRFHRAWCNDEWQYFGVVLSIVDEDGDEVEGDVESLWGLEHGYESDGAYKSWEYLTEVANDLLSEYLLKHPAALVKTADDEEEVEAKATSIVFSTTDEAEPSATLLRFESEADADAFERALRRATNVDHEGIDKTVIDEVEAAALLNDCDLLELPHKLTDDGAYCTLCGHVFGKDERPR